LRSKMPARVKALAASPRNRYSGYSFPTEAWRQTLSRPASIAHRAGSMPNNMPGTMRGNVLSTGDERVDDAELARTPLGRRWMSISKIFAAQWPSIVLSMILIIESMFFAAVFWAEDIKIVDLNTTTPATVNFEACLIQSGGDKSECLALASPLTIGKRYIVGSMTLMAVSALHTHSQQSLCIHRHLLTSHFSSRAYKRHSSSRTAACTPAGGHYCSTHGRPHTPAGHRTTPSPSSSLQTQQRSPPPSRHPAHPLRPPSSPSRRSSPRSQRPRSHAPRTTPSHHRKRSHRLNPRRRTAPSRCGAPPSSRRLSRRCRCRRSRLCGNALAARWGCAGRRAIATPAAEMGCG